MITAVSAVSFSDVSANKWYTEPIQFCVEKNYVSGYKDGTFKPDQSITRAEFSVIMNKFCKERGLIKEDAPLTNNPYKDVQLGKWYTQPVLNCAKAGVMTGYSSSKFGVNDKLTREQAAVIFAKAINIFEHHKISVIETYRDSYKIDRWAEKSVYLAKCYGFMKGTGNNLYEPLKAVTRAEIATIVAAVSKIDEETIKVENSLSNAVQATYNLEDLFYEDKIQKGIYDYDFNEIDNWAYSEIDLTNSRTFWYLTWNWANTYRISDMTEEQVVDVAYAMFAQFDGNVPKYQEKEFSEQDGGWSMFEYKNGKYHSEFGDRGEVYNRVKEYVKNSDGSLDVIVEAVTDFENKALDRYTVHMIPNTNVNAGAGRFEFFYTVENVTRIK